MFKFGVDSLIWTENFTENDLPLIGKAKSLGFSVIDINVAHPDRFPTRAVRDEIRNTGIDVVTTIGLPADCNTIDPDPAVRRHGIDTLKLLVDINIEIGSGVLGGVIYASWGYLSGACRTEEEWEWSVSAMREVAEYAASKSDLVLAVEPVNRFESHFINTAADAVKFVKAVGLPNVKVLLDTFHMIREESNITQAVLEAGSYVGYVHTNENHRGIPGSGLVPWVEFFTALKRINYDGCLTIESFDPTDEQLSRMGSIWRRLADSPEQLATEGLKFLKGMYQKVYG